MKGGDDFYHAIWPEGASFSNESSVPVSAGEYDATIVSPLNADGSIYDFIDDIHIDTSKPDDIPITLTHVDADNVNPEAVFSLVAIGPEDGINFRTQGKKRVIIAFRTDDI